MKPFAWLALGATAVALGSGPGPAQSSSVAPPLAPAQPIAAAQDGGLDVIDFEGLPAGTIPTAVFGAGGTGPVFVSGLNPSFGAGVNAAVIFDSSNPTGDDFDLGTPNETCPVPGPGIGDAGEVGSPTENCDPLGNLLIVGENLVDLSPADGLVDDPDDADLVGASLTFDFSALGSVSLCSLTIVDVEANEPGAEVVLTFDDASTLAFLIPQTGNNGVATLDIPCGLFPNVVTAEIIINGSGAIDNLVFLTEQGKVCNPCIDVIAKCEDAGPGEPIPFMGRVANCGDVDLLNVFVVNDNGTPGITGDDVLILAIPLLPPGEQMGFTGSYFPSVPAGDPSTLVVTGIGSPPEACKSGDVTDSMSATCTQTPGNDAEGCTPGFWKNHTELWDEPSDPIAAAAGFTTSTSFNQFFGLTAAESGFPDSLTMLGAVQQGGGGPYKLGRHGVPALLNLAAGLAYDLPDGIADAAALAQAITDAYLSDTYEPLASQLAAANEAGCPF